MGARGECVRFQNRGDQMINRKLAMLAPLVVIAATVVSSASAPAGGGASPAVEPQLIDDASLKAISATVGGADVLPTTRTIAHWWGSVNRTGIVGGLIR
jgi:hypothetical protein